MRYSVVIHKDPDSDFGVTVPDLPGCFSAGDTVEDALVEVTEAIECHIEALLQDKENIPSPLPCEVHRQNPDFSNAYLWGTVDVIAIALR